jgi:hypothetical protein
MKPTLPDISRNENPENIRAGLKRDLIILFILIIKILYNQDIFAIFAKRFFRGLFRRTAIHLY